MPTGSRRLGVCELCSRTVEPIQIVVISEDHWARTGKRFGGVHLFETVAPARLRETLSWSEVIVKIIAEEE